MAKKRVMRRKAPKRRRNAPKRRNTVTKRRRAPTKRRRRAPSKKQSCSAKFKRILHRLKTLKPCHRKQAISLANNRFIRDLCSEVKKLRTTQNVDPKLRNKLHQHAPELRKLANKTTSIKSKRKILTQSGGFLPLLLAALPAVGSILGGVISRA